MEALNSAKKRLQRARNNLKSYAKLEHVISEYSDVQKTVSVMQTNVGEAVGAFGEWAVDESSALEEFAGDLSRIGAEEDEASGALAVATGVFVAALREIRDKQKDLDALLKRQRDAQTAHAKAYKKNEKAKSQKKYAARKDELEADVESSAAAVRELADSVEHMKFVAARFAHTTVRAAMTAYNAAIVAYHKECLELAQERAQMISFIPDVVAIEDGIYKYSNREEPAADGAVGASAAASVAGVAVAASSTDAGVPLPADAEVIPSMSNNAVAGAPNSFDSAFWLQCTAAGGGVEACGRTHVFALNRFGSSRIRIDCECMAMLAFDVRDESGGLYLGSGFVALDSGGGKSADDDDVCAHAGPWPKADFLDDPWEELWAEPTTERSRVETRRLNGPVRVMATARPDAVFVPRRADQLAVEPDARYIIAEDCGEWWYGMVIGGDFGFVRKDLVVLDEEGPDAASSGANARFAPRSSTWHADPQAQSSAAQPDDV